MSELVATLLVVAVSIWLISVYLERVSRSEPVPVYPLPFVSGGESDDD